MCSGKAAYAPDSSDASQSASVHVLSEPRTISSGVSPAHSRTAQPSFRRSPAMRRVRESKLLEIEMVTE